MNIIVGLFLNRLLLLPVAMVEFSKFGEWGQWIGVDWKAGLRKCFCIR